MVASILCRRKCYILSFVILISCCSSGRAQDDLTKDTGKDFLCFNNKLIYIGCDEAFRLNQSGIMLVPTDATDRFCNGPCLLETKLLLTCIDKIDSSYVFNNKATPQDTRNALEAGCSNTSDRGNFNVGEYTRGSLSNLASKSFHMRFLDSACTACLCFWIANHL